MKASRFFLKSAKSKGMLSGVLKPYCLLSRRASAMDAKFQVIFLGTHLSANQNRACFTPSQDILRIGLEQSP